MTELKPFEDAQLSNWVSVFGSAGLRVKGSGLRKYRYPRQSTESFALLRCFLAVQMMYDSCSSLPSSHRALFLPGLFKSPKHQNGDMGNARDPGPLQTSPDILQPNSHTRKPKGLESLNPTL